MLSTKRIKNYKIYINEKIGKGAYGTVYKGENESDGQEVAVKVIDKTNINSDPYMKDALFSQIKIMRSVHSQHIVNFYDALESKNNYYIIQEYCDGGDLQQFLTKKPGKCCSQAQAIKILTEICQGFLVLVKEGILHRDLKPANILLSGGHAKICDFGFAKKNVPGLKNKTIVGTPLYMPLQILKGQPYTSKCDIWTIGFLFYEMLHGKTPWTAKCQFNLIKSLQTLPLKIKDDLAADTINFIKKTLQIHESNRMDWQELFAHPIFKDFFAQEIKIYHGNLQDTFKKIMADIRFQINSNNIDLMKLWDHLGYNSQKELNQNEFREFLKCVLPKMAPIQQNYFHSKMDINKNGLISLKEIQAHFTKFSIPLTAKFSDKIPFTRKNPISVEQDHSLQTEIIEENPQQQQTLRKAREAFRKMDHILTKKNVSLYKVFNIFDKDKSGMLDLGEFGRIMKKLDNEIGDDQIKIIFDVVDTDNSKSIEFLELNSYFCKVNGIPESLALPKEYGKK